MSAQEGASVRSPRPPAAFEVPEQPGDESASVEGAPRICFLMEDFFPVLHGATTQIMLLGARFAARGANVLVVTRRIRREHPRSERLLGFRIERVSPSVGLHRVGKFLMLPGAFWALLRQRSRYDVIVVSDLKVLGALGVLVAAVLRRPCVLRAESCGELDITEWLEANRGPHPILWRVVRRLAPLRDAWLRRAHCFLSISSAMTDEFRRTGVPDDQIVEITNGIDTERFSPADPRHKADLRRELGLPEGRIFVYAGRLGEGKGLDWLLEVWKDFGADASDAYLVLVGGAQGFDMDIDERLRSYVRDHGLANRVYFTGLVNNVQHYLQAADYFVLPSRSEGLGISLLEAMACGLPSVASSVGGILDIIEDGSNGLLVPYGDSERLRSAFQRLLDSGELARQLGSAGRETVLTRFGIEHIADQYFALFARATGHEIPS